MCVRVCIYVCGCVDDTMFMCMYMCVDESVCMCMYVWMTVGFLL